MERLTRRDNGGNAFRNCDNCEIKFRESCCSTKLCTNNLIARLAAYEDTGLTPAQIQHILPRQSAEEAVERMKAERERYDEWFAWKQAKEDGRLVILPCKAGETVYVLTERGIVAKGVVRAFRQFDRLVADVEYQRYGLYATSRYWGETVFLTREEAEAAWKQKTTQFDDEMTRPSGLLEDD